MAGASPERVQCQIQARIPLLRHSVYDDIDALITSLSDTGHFLTVTKDISHGSGPNPHSVGRIQAFWLPFASVYATAFEIREYSESFIRGHGLGVYYNFQHEKVCAAWDDENARWNFHIRTMLRDYHYKILATFLLTVWNQNLFIWYKGGRTRGRTIAK